MFIAYNYSSAGNLRSGVTQADQNLVWSKRINLFPNTTMKMELLVRPRRVRKCGSLRVDWSGCPLPVTHERTPHSRGGSHGSVITVTANELPATKLPVACSACVYCYP